MDLVEDVRGLILKEVPARFEEVTIRRFRKELEPPLKKFQMWLQRIEERGWR